MRLSILLGFSCLTLPSLGFPTSQERLEARTLSTDDKIEAVKEAFRHGFNGYMKHAYPNDELKPVSNGHSNPLNGWGATSIDSLSTALLMELQDVVDQVLDHVQSVDYTQTDYMCSLFETTIRYLGGMISGYDLLKGPFSHMASDDDKVDALLEQSQTLAEVLKFGFNSKSGIPWNGLNITAQKTDGGKTNGIATIGTLVLEWTRLSDLTGNPEYGKLAQRAEGYLLSPKPEKNEPFPGLIGSDLDIETGLIQHADVSWEAGDDSFYEYLLKMYIYDRERFGKYKDRWVLAANSSIEHLKSSPSSRPDLTYIAAWEGGELALHSQHLACFAGGNFILGGRELGRKEYIEFGLQLVEGCYNTYNSSLTRIGPESFAWDESKVPEEQKDFYEKNGFYYTNAAYGLRPEVIESYYYAYRITGETKYQDWAWEAFVAINATTRTDTGFSNLKNVNAPNGEAKTDDQPSFLFAETFKYIYLTVAPDAEWHVSPDGRDKWVYNTEAHPIKVKG